jgi:hypothetical protein
VVAGVPVLSSLGLLPSYVAWLSAVCVFAVECFCSLFFCVGFCLLRPVALWFFCLSPYALRVFGAVLFLLCWVVCACPVVLWWLVALRLVL